MPWRDPGDRYHPDTPYGALDREGRVRFLVMSLRMQMRWHGEDGQDELTVFGPGGHVQARAYYSDVDELLSTVLTALAYCWDVQPSVFVGLVNERLGAAFGVDPTVPRSCYRNGGMLPGALKDHWPHTPRPLRRPLRARVGGLGRGLSALLANLRARLSRRDVA